MYNNLLILKLPWLSRHAHATVQTKFKLPIMARTDIYLKKTVCLKIFIFPSILAVLAISLNMHYSAITTFTRSFRPRFTTHPIHAEKCI